MTVIELGLVQEDAGRVPERRPLRRGELRRWLAAAVGVLCLLTVTGSAVPNPRGLPTLWRTALLDTDEYRLVGDVVYLMRTFGGATVAKHDARTGAELWKTGEIPDASGLGPIRNGVLLVPSDRETVQLDLEDGTSAYEDFNRETAAVDTSTGRQLWRAPGDLSASTDDLAILAEHEPTGGGLRTLRVVRPRDGSPVWSRPAGNYQNWVITDGPASERVVMVTEDGVVDVLNLADGRLVTSKKVPWPRSPATQEDTMAMLDGDSLFVISSSPTKTTVIAYEADTMRELWRLERPGGGGIFDCGPVLCLNSDAGTDGYDRETGRPRWHIEGRANGYPIFGNLLLTNNDNAGPRYGLTNRETGKLVIDLGSVSPVWNAGDVGSPYFLKRSTDLPGYTALSYFQEKSGELFMRGKLPPVRDFGCQQEGDLLACSTDDQHLLVMDVG
jgi:outer membrane protein assembly factor BamB